MKHTNCRTKGCGVCDKTVHKLLHTNFDDEIYHEPQPDLWDKVVTYGSLISFGLFISYLIVRSIF